MSANPDIHPGPIHLCLQLPEGEAAALGSLDLALTLKAQLGALGHPVSLAARQLRPDALNLVLGIGWGFDEEAAQGHRVALVTPPLAPPGTPGHVAVPWRLAQRWPQDLAVVKLAQYLAFNRGDAPAMLRIILAVLPAHAHNAHAHGMAAFAYEQAHRLDEAEASGQAMARSGSSHRMDRSHSRA